MTKNIVIETDVGEYHVSGLDVKLIIAGHVRPLRDASMAPIGGPGTGVYKTGKTMIARLPDGTTLSGPAKVLWDAIN